MRGMPYREQSGSASGLIGARPCQQHMVPGRLPPETKNPWLRQKSESETLSECWV